MKPFPSLISPTAPTESAVIPVLLFVPETKIDWVDVELLKRPQCERLTVVFAPETVIPDPVVASASMQSPSFLMSATARPQTLALPANHILEKNRLSEW